MAMYTHLKYSGSINSERLPFGKVTRTFTIKEQENGIRCAICGKEIKDRTKITVCPQGKLLMHYLCDRTASSCDIAYKYELLEHDHVLCEQIIIEKPKKCKPQ